MFCFYVAINFSYHWGNFTQAISNRLALIYLPFFVISAVYTIKKFENQQNVVKCILPIFCIFHIIFFLPFCDEQSNKSKVVLSNQYNKVSCFIISNKKVAIETKPGSLKREKNIMTN